jgi:hypothetical protein
VGILHDGIASRPVRPRLGVDAVLDEEEEEDSNQPAGEAPGDVAGTGSRVRLSFEKKLYGRLGEVK